MEQWTPAARASRPTSACAPSNNGPIPGMAGSASVVGYQFPPPKPQFHQQPQRPTTAIRPMAMPMNGFNSEWHSTRPLSPIPGNDANFQTQHFANTLRPPRPGHMQNSSPWPSPCNQYSLRNQHFQQGHMSSTNCNLSQPPDGFRPSNPSNQGFHPQSFGSPPHNLNICTDSYPHQKQLIPRPRCFNNSGSETIGRPSFTNNWNNFPRRSWQPQGHHNKPSSNKPSVVKDSTACVCEPCEKEFKCKEDFVAHQRSHVKCEFDGCPFIASRKMIKLHFIKNHEEAKSRIRLETDDEIAKWKEERKRKYPSASKVSQKIVEEEEKRRNGQVLKTKEFRYKGKVPYDRANHRRGNNSRRDGRGNRHFNKNPELSSDNSIDEVKVKVTEITQNGLSLEETDSIRTFSETRKDPESTSVSKTDIELSDTLNGNDKSEPRLPVKTITDQEESPISTCQVTDIIVEQTDIQLDGVASPKKELDPKSNALLSICAYMSEGESDHVESVDKEHTKSQPKTSDTPNKPEYPSEFQQTVVVPNKINYKVKFQKRKRGKNNNYKKFNNITPPMRRRPNLLEMLLASDIRHERNVILQCIRHIIQNKFFDD